MGVACRGHRVVLRTESAHDRGDPRDDRTIEYRPRPVLPPMSAKADAVCGAPYGVSSPERGNVRNGDRHREFDIRAAPWTWVSTRRMEKLVEQLGTTRLSKSQVSVMI
jgi:transposase-like protein